MKPVYYRRRLDYYVTPFTGVWIETYQRQLLFASELSLPSRECGLKLFCCITVARVVVTPFTGVWIETVEREKIGIQVCHSLHGSVD